MNYYTLLPEEIVDYIIDFKIGTALYRKDKKKWKTLVRMVHYELDRWYKSKFSLSFLKSTDCQKKRAPAFRKSLRTGPPLMVCHVGLFHSPEEIRSHIEWYLSRNIVEYTVPVRREVSNFSRLSLFSNDNHF